MQTLSPLKRLLFALMSVLLAATPSVAQSLPSGEPEREVLGRQHEGPIRVVFQITAGTEVDGVNKALRQLQVLRTAYRETGVAADQVDIRAVIHGPASAALLTDGAWAEHTGRAGPNPNTAVIEELARPGVSLELCDVRRVREGWSKADIHPAVLLVSSAYVRLVDLQMQGYSYVRI